MIERMYRTEGALTFVAASMETAGEIDQAVTGVRAKGRHLGIKYDVLWKRRGIAWD